MITLKQICYLSKEGGINDIGKINVLEKKWSHISTGYMWDEHQESEADSVIKTDSNVSMVHSASQIIVQSKPDQYHSCSIRVDQNVLLYILWLARFFILDSNASSRGLVGMHYFIRSSGVCSISLSFAISIFLFCAFWLSSRSLVSTISRKLG